MQNELNASTERNGSDNYFVEWTVDVGQIQSLSTGMKELQHYLQCFHQTGWQPAGFP